MKTKIIKTVFLYLLGCYSYSLIEICWRGHTHPSMFFAGGICFLALFYISHKYRNLHPMYICILSSLVITTVELIFGLIFNIGLRLQVWDYSSLPFNFLGQISMLYSVLWGLLSIAIIPLCRKINKSCENVSLIKI